MFSETDWKAKFEDGEEVKDTASITGVVLDAYNILITKYKTHYEAIADKAVKEAAITDSTNYEELMQITVYGPPTHTLYPYP